MSWKSFWRGAGKRLKNVNVGKLLAGVGMVIAGAAASTVGVGAVGVVGGVATIASAFAKKKKEN